MLFEEYRRRNLFLEQKTRAEDTKDMQDTQETKDAKDTKDAEDTKDTQDTKDIKDTEDHTKDHTNIVSREESTDLGVQNSWCIELLVRTTIPPTFSKNNKGAPSARPCGARSAPVIVVFATWWNYGAHQEFCAPRILYTKICAPLSGNNISVVLPQFTSSLFCTKKKTSTKQA